MKGYRGFLDWLSKSAALDGIGPGEMIADAFGVSTPYTRGRDNHKSHLSKMQKRRKAAAKAAKQARKRNRAR